MRFYCPAFRCLFRIRVHLAVAAALLATALPGWAADVRAEVQQRIASLDRAILKGSLNDLNGHFDADGVFVNEEGKVVSRKTYLAGLINPETVYKTAKSRPDALRVFGEVVIESGVFEATGTLRGKPYHPRVRYTSTWIKRNGTWVIIGEQGQDVSPVK